MPITKATASSIAPAAKGDLVVGSATNDAAVLGVGSNDQVLTADSSTATGLKWATAASGGLDLLSTTSLSGSSVTVSSISQDYDQLVFTATDVYFSGGTGFYFQLRFNSDTNLNYSWGWTSATNAGNSYDANSGTNAIRIAQQGTLSGATEKLGLYAVLPNYTSTGMKLINASSFGYVNYNTGFWSAGTYTGGSAISSITFLTGSSNFSGGTVKIYGVK